MTVTPFSNLALEATPNVTVIALDKELVRGTDSLLTAELLPRVRKESVVLDLSGVERVDAAGIAALAMLYCNAVDAGTNFAITAPSPHVREMLRIVGLEVLLVIGSKNAAAANCCDLAAFAVPSAA